MGLIPDLGRSPGGGHGNPLQHSCLENPMDWGTWRATVHRVAQSWTRLSDLALMHIGDVQNDPETMFHLPGSSSLWPSFQL